MKRVGAAAGFFLALVLYRAIMMDIVGLAFAVPIALYFSVRFVQLMTAARPRPR